MNVFRLQICRFGKEYTNQKQTIMKRVLLLAAIATCSASMAQTLNITDTTSIGSSIDYWVVDSNVVTLDAVTGTAVTWDYSDILAYNLPMQTNTVVDVVGTTWESDFGAASYMEDFTDGLKTYFSHTATETIINGFVLEGDFEIVMVYNTDPLVALQYPMNQGDTYVDDIIGEATATGIPLPITMTGTATVTADGTGTLKIGDTDFTGVIRVKTVEVTSGTTPFGPADVTRTSYNYYQVGSYEMPIFRIDDIVVEIPAAGTLGFRSAYSIEQITDYVGVEESVELNEFTIYPNPATDVATIKMTNKVESLTVYNAVGQVIEQIQNPATNVNLNTSQFETGIYFVELKVGENISTKKLVIK